MTIREYRPADRNTCIQIFQKNIGISFTEEELPFFENWLHNHQEYPFFVVQKGLRIIACGGIYVDHRYGMVGLTWSMVDPLYQDQGVGTELTIFRIKQIRKAFPDLPCFIETSQYAKGFYQKLGFQTKSIVKNGLADGMDKYFMQLPAA